jgi:hypothetical protein
MGKAIVAGRALTRADVAAPTPIALAGAPG